MDMTPKRITIAKALKLIAMDFDDMMIDDDVLLHWEEMLSDIPDDLILAAVKLTKMQSQFRPKVADVRKTAQKLLHPEMEMDSGQAWGLVLQAVRRYGKPQTRQALESLPPAVSAVVRQIGFDQICDSEDPQVVRAHFLRIFESRKTHEEGLNSLPPALQQYFRTAIEGSTQTALNAPEKIALPNYQPDYDGRTRTSGYTPPNNVVAFRKRQPSRSAEELAQQAEILRQSAKTGAETAEFRAMTEQERAEHLRQQAEQLGGAA